jgi:hypothetical protein
MCERNLTNKQSHPAISSTSTAMTGVALVPSIGGLLNQPTQSGYTSSTLSSTTSSLNNNTTLTKKKSISPIIAESIKASAALSASSTTTTTPENNRNGDSNEILYSNITNNTKDHQHSPVSKNQVIRMIDTDNEDNDLSNDSSEPIRLDKLDEEEKLDTSITTTPLDTYEKGLSLHPPSFKTAVSSRPMFSRTNNNNNNFTPINVKTTAPPIDYLHQYQNDIDLNLHSNNTLPRIPTYQS